MGAVCDEAVGNGVRGDMRGDAVRGMNGGCCLSRCGRQWGAG